MTFENLQIFTDTYPPEAAFWCNNNRTHFIKEIDPLDGHRRFQIVEIPKPTAGELSAIEERAKRQKNRRHVCPIWKPPLPNLVSWLLLTRMRQTAPPSTLRPTRQSWKQELQNWRRRTMAKIYYRMIKTGRMIIDEVPTRWRAAVQAMLDAE